MFQYIIMDHVNLNNFSDRIIAHSLMFCFFHFVFVYILLCYLSPVSLLNIIVKTSVCFPFIGPEDERRQPIMVSKK